MNDRHHLNLLMNVTEAREKLEVDLPLIEGANATNVRRLRDVSRQIAMVEAVIAAGVPDMSTLEIHVRHDYPGAQYIAMTLTEQAQIEAAGALERGLQRLHAEASDLSSRLDEPEPGEDASAADEESIDAE